MLAQVEGRPTREKETPTSPIITPYYRSTASTPYEIREDSTPGHEATPFSRIIKPHNDELSKKRKVVPSSASEASGPEFRRATPATRAKAHPE
ncbi:MAG: hypothetical protein RMJ66_07550 [Bacteroidia bacterium]|nr:hypothetical protein [Bacteroidia bacterium]